MLIPDFPVSTSVIPLSNHERPGIFSLFSMCSLTWPIPHVQQFLIIDASFSPTRMPFTACSSSAAFPRGCPPHSHELWPPRLGYPPHPIWAMTSSRTSIHPLPIPLLLMLTLLGLPPPTAPMVLGLNCSRSEGRGKEEIWKEQGRSEISLSQAGLSVLQWGRHSHIQ